ncbi:hypothetical protein GCM10027084_28760 [Pseudoxanthomonas sangjuensis]|uniref:hypothetical protein n=1 Tax=Pseudoxanthomonas sangjuensis TaxID=1503750 RepID=UPI001391244F|nr:hypothetical protein [Pseudoxanthomonas sangjuensis]
MRFLAIPLVALLCSCSTFGGPDYSQIEPGYYGGDGSSPEQAVLAVGLNQSGPAWIAEKYPGSTIKMQALAAPPGKKRYDVYTVEKADGETVQVWFLLSGGLSDLKP